MSYEIYYDRAFIKVNEGLIPLVNQGSNNTWEIGRHGRDIPEKNWQVLNWHRRSQLIFSKEEIEAIATDYEEISQSSGTCFKTRYRPFEAGEFGRWILCGFRSAYTVEEYIRYGNQLEINDYSGEYGNWRQYPFSNTAELLALVEKLKGRPLLNVHFLDNRQVYRPKYMKVRRIKNH